MAPSCRRCEWHLARRRQRLTLLASALLLRRPGRRADGAPQWPAANGHDALLCGRRRAGGHRVSRITERALPEVSRVAGTCNRRRGDTPKAIAKASTWAMSAGHNPRSRRLMYVWLNGGPARSASPCCESPRLLRRSSRFEPKNEEENPITNLRRLALAPYALRLRALDV